MTGQMLIGFVVVGTALILTTVVVLGELWRALVGRR